MIHKLLDWLKFKLGIYSPSRLYGDLDYCQRVATADPEFYYVFLEAQRKNEQRLAELFDSLGDDDLEEEVDDATQ